MSLVQVFNKNLCEENKQKRLNITIFNKEKLISILNKNEDNFYQKLTPKDLIARGLNTIDDYSKKIEESCIDINCFEKALLIDSIEEANNKLRKYKTAGFDGEKCAQIKWAVGIINGNKYEYGIPHSRGNIIICPKYLFNDKNTLIKILIYLKIHLYQKIYPYDTKIFLDVNGFIKYKKRTLRDNYRANPNLDNWIYKNRKNLVYEAVYKEYPNNIIDIIIRPLDSYNYEHPFIFMADSILDTLYNSNLYMSNVINNKTFVIERSNKKESEVEYKYDIRPDTNIDMKKIESYNIKLI